MPVAYILTLVFAAGAAGGAFTTYRLEQAKVLKLELAIAQANNKSQAVLRNAEVKVQAATIEAQKLNQDLEEANKTHVETINYYYDALHSELAKRVYTGNKTCSSNAVSKNSDSRTIEEAASQTGISESLARFLESQLELADTTANYAQTAYQFIHANCGIKNDD